MREKIGHTLQRLQQALEKKEFKVFAEETRKLYELIKDSEQPIESFVRLISEIALRLYNNFEPSPAVELYLNSSKFFHPQLAEALRAKLKDNLELFLHWQRQMEQLTKERLAREIRERIRADEYSEAVILMQKLLSLAKDPETYKQQVQLVGSVLGSLENDQPRVDKTLAVFCQRATEWQIEPAIIETIEKVRQERYRLMLKARMENRELEWTRSLADAARELKNYLPMHNEIGEPTAEELEKFRQLLTAIFNTAFEPQQHHRWIDIALLLSELAPVPVSSTAITAGVEQRISEGLGPTAQMVVARTFKQLGDHPRLCNALIKFLPQLDNVRYYKAVIELIGLLGSPLFIPFLLEAQSNKKFSSFKSEIALALGNIGNPAVIEPLAIELRKILSAKVIDPPRVREAMIIIRTLSRIFHSPAANDTDRNNILEYVTQVVPATELYLCRDIALEFFNHPRAKNILPELKPAHIAWAVSSLVKSLWLQDPTPHFARGEEKQRTILGFREQIAQCIIGLGNQVLAFVINEAQQQLHRFCGAYMAMGEILAEIGDTRAIPLLEEMLINTYIAEEKPKNVYEEEYYWDVAEGRRKPLTKDKIASALIYALDKINTTEGEEILIRLMKQIQQGQLPVLGTESSNVLLNANMRIARNRGTSAFATSGAPADKVAKPELKDEQKIKKLITALKSPFPLTIFPILNSRIRERKIMALKQLSEMPAPLSIQAIVNALGDSDKMVQEAAKLAIFDLLKPTSSSETIESVCQALILTLDAEAGTSRQKNLQNIISKLDFSRPVIKNAVMKAMKNMKDKRIINYLGELILKADEESERKLKDSGSDALLPTGEQRKDQAEMQKPKKFVDKVALKRQYLEARRRWIQSGKKGPPPEPPDE
ncbi:MAG: hypothetical protein N2246_03965 [Candidatus Sumerlaeia bacterium]|nr:hypothetical protein [Candidatus Sumerlaeia bacterium]